MKTSFEKFVMCQANSHISLEEQETIINSLPNDSTPQGRASIAHDAYFSTGTIVENDDIMTRSKYIPSSVQNKILYYWRLNALDDILQTLLHVKSTQEKKSRESFASQRHSRRTTSTFECPDPQYDFEPVTHAVQEETTPYVKFLQHLVGQSGVLKWRIHSHDLDTIAMNDIDLETGCFVKNHFAHVFRTVSSETTNITHTCTCRMYSTTQQMEGHGQTCCHVRFFTEEIEPQFNALWSHNVLLPAQTPIQKKIRDALQEANVSVVRLDSDPRYHRFSVLTPDMSSCTVVILQGNYVSCQSGRCRATKGHSRKIIKISDPSNCQHLQAMYANEELWSHLYNSQYDSDDDNIDPHDNITVDPAQDIPEAVPSTAVNISVIHSADYCRVHLLQTLD